MGVGILAKRVVLELGSSTNFVYSLRAERLCFCVVGVKILAEEGGVRFYCQNT